MCNNVIGISPQNNEAMAWVPLKDIILLKNFRDKMDNENTVMINESSGFYGRSTYYTTSDEKLKQVLVELEVSKALETDLQSEISILKNKIQRLESMGFWEFIKKRYFTKKSKPMK